MPRQAAVSYQPEDRVVSRIADHAVGDSITYGKVNNNLRKLGGYRTELWQKFEADGLTDFVGSQSTGPDSLGDKDHEGHPGKRIGWIDDNVDGWNLYAGHCHFDDWHE